MLIAKRVLILEDQSIIAMLLAKVLSNMGHSVLAIVGSVSDAMVAAHRTRPDLMIVDARLRDGSGVSAVREIIRTGFVPYVFVSGDNCRANALHRGSAALEKPYRESELCDAIQFALEGATLMRDETEGPGDG